MTTQSEAHPPIIAVNISPAMSGFFSCLYRWTDHPDGFGYYDIYETSAGRWATWQEANVEAERWGKETGLTVQLASQERIDASAAKVARLRSMLGRIKELREQGMDLPQARAQAEAERAQAEAAA